MANWLIRSKSDSEAERRTGTPLGGSRRAPQVLFLPDYSQHNPHQRMLAAGLAEQGVRVRYGRPRGYLSAPILGFWLTRGRPEVVHIHWTHEFLGVRGASTNRLASARFFAQLRLLQRMHVRIVWTIHNLGAHDGNHGASETAAHRRLVKLADGIICHCRAARDAAIEAFEIDARDQAKLHVIPHGSYAGEYPDSIDRATARGRLGLSADARVFLFIGAVRAYKGTDELIRSFGELPGAGARLIIAGRPANKRIEEQIRLAAEADPRIMLRMEFIPAADLQVYLRACDVVVLPFRDILTSGSAILALTFGRPVIAPSIGCLPETVPPGAGMLYEPKAPDALAKALLEALGTDLSAMEAPALARANELSWRSIAERTAALYRR